MAIALGLAFAAPAAAYDLRDLSPHDLTIIESGLKKLDPCKAQACALGAGGQSAVRIDLRALTLEDIRTIGAGLDELPRKEGDDGSLYQRLNEQIAAQNKAQVEAVRDAVKRDLDAEKKAKPPEAKPQPQPQPEPTPEGPK